MASSIAPLERLASLLDPRWPQDSSPDAVKRRRALAEQLARQAGDPNGAGGSMFGAIGQGLKGLASGMAQAHADRDEASGMATVNAALGRVGAGGAPAQGLPGIPAPIAPAAAPASGVTRDRGGVPANIPSFVAAAGQPYGISPTYMTTVADIESRGNPNAKNPSGASGLFQFMPGTARQYGLSNPFDPAASADAAARLASDNRGILRRTLGRDPTEGELYLAHQQGAGGAGKLLSNPNARAADLVGRAAVVQNGGRPNMSAAEFSGLWTGKYDQRAGRQAAADMPAAGAEPVSFLTDQRDPNGGYFIPPADRAMAPAGDPSGPRPGDGIAPSPPPSANPDLAALTAPQAMGPAQTFLPPTAIPAPVPQDAPLPPARPAAADLMAQPTTPAPAAPEPPPAVAQAPQPQSVPLPPARPSDAALYAQPVADMPAPGAVPATGMAPPIDPNAQDAGAGAFARRQGIDAMLGGLQDGLDRIFGGPETQRRLDRQIAALGGVPQASPQALRLASALEAGSAPAGAPGPSPAADPRRAATIAALDPAGAQGGLSPVPAMPQAGGQIPAASVPQPTGYAQAGGMSADRQRDLLAIANSGYATPQVRQFALDQLNPKLNHIDMGDSIGFVDQGGNLMRSYPKTRGPMTVSPGSTLADPSTGREIYRNPKEQDTFRSLTTPQDRAAAGIPADDRRPYQVGSDGKLFSPGGSGTNVTVNNAVNPVLQGLGQQFVEGAAAARAAADTVRSIHGARAQLDTPGGIFAGAGADTRLALQKMGAALGVADPDKITNTETFRAAIKPIVLDTVKGLGAGSGISNADRDFALQAAGGDIALDESTIRRVLDITERANRSKIDRHNALSDRMVQTQPDYGAVAPMLRIDAPGEYQRPAAPAVPATGRPDTSGWTTIDGVKIRRKAP